MYCTFTLEYNWIEYSVKFNDNSLKCDLHMVINKK